MIINQIILVNTLASIHVYSPFRSYSLSNACTCMLLLDCHRQRTDDFGMAIDDIGVALELYVIQDWIFIKIVLGLA